MNVPVNTSPLMRQYLAIKQQYPDALLLFQVGDFYELFFEDAQRAAEFLGITLTKRGTLGDQPIPLARVPVHMVDHYLQKLVKGGYKVALCDQVSEPTPGKIVERSVRQVITPGTLVDDRLFPDTKAQYLGVYVEKDASCALIFCDILTGTLFTTILPHNDRKTIEAELVRFSPREIVSTAMLMPKNAQTWCLSRGFVLSLLDDVHWQSYLDQSASYVSALQHPLLAHSMLGQQGLRILFAYLLRNQPKAVEYCTSLQWYAPHDYLMLDEATQRNLEIVEPLHQGTLHATLFDVLNEAVTPMGSRCIRQWLLRPLVSRQLIEQRHAWVDIFKRNPVICDALRALLKEIGDLERIVGRIALARATAHDYKNLLRALQAIPQLMQRVSQLPGDTYFEFDHAELQECFDVIKVLHDALNDDDAQAWLIRKGFNQELDTMRYVVAHGTDAILALEQQEQQRTGIASLKIRDHQSHGYGIEVTKANVHLVPGGYVRVQSLVNRDRFTCQALKDLEHALRHAHAECQELEKHLFSGVCTTILRHLPILRKTVDWVTRLDALTTFGYCAYDRGYIRADIVESRTITIKKGKHPVIAQVLRHEFKPNDIHLDDTQRVLVITGPNMGGKSTYLRQVALLTIMSQAGSFIPAESAQLMIVDRIFTRIGASDNVARGESTFFIEMKEAAAICSAATPQSLVILDEIGRGTSTYDGLALAQAILEYMYEDRQSRCLFATHYHELTHLAQTMPAVKNYHAASVSFNNEVILLHEIRPGIAEGSFGIAVARMAAMPDKVVERARVLKLHYESVKN